MRYDKGSSFRSRAFKGECRLLQTIIRLTLERMDCDVDRHTNWQTEGIFYNNHDMVRYCVNVFLIFPIDEDGCCWLVEIQRRHGNVLLFTHFFRDFLRKLTRDVVHETAGDRDTLTFMDSTEELPGYGGGVVLSKKAVGILLQTTKTASLEKQVTKVN